VCSTAAHVVVCVARSDIDFDALLRKEITPPWTPDVKGVMDFKYVVVVAAL
jgi:hypothetical protein